MPAASLDNLLTANSTANAARTGVQEPSSAARHGEGLTWTSMDVRDSGAKKTRRGAVRQQDIAEFTSQLAIMSRSGIDVASALASLARQCQRPALAEVLHEVHEAVMAGSTLSEALRRQDHVFDHSFIATVAAGEASGMMSDVLRQLADMQRSEMRSRRAMHSMMIYPILLMTVSSSVILALTLFVLPTFSEIFAQYEITLPMITQMLIALASELRGRWWLWGPLVFLAAAGMWTWRKTAHGRCCLDLLWMRTPVIQRIAQSHYVARTCQLLGLMLESGVPLLESLQLAREAVNNALYKRLLLESEEAVLNGRNLASVWQTTEVVPQSAREMIITAENTGNLGEVAHLLGDYYNEEAQARMRQLVGLLEPAITVGMGFVVACVVLAVMLPVFDLSTIGQK
ncbi:MAG: type II secretion system F family protein [Pirellulales bacterium]|nr:type II secretion system F family protein [Pirellulales bacterium]